MPSKLKSIKLGMTEVENTLRRTVKNKLISEEFENQCYDVLTQLRKKVLTSIDEVKEIEDNIKILERNTLYDVSSDNNPDSNLSTPMLNQMKDAEVDEFRLSLLEVAEIESREKVMEKRGKILGEIHV